MVLPVPFHPYIKLNRPKSLSSEGHEKSRNIPHSVNLDMRLILVITIEQTFVSYMHRGPLLPKRNVLGTTKRTRHLVQLHES